MNGHRLVSFLLRTRGGIGMRVWNIARRQAYCASPHGHPSKGLQVVWRGPAESAVPP